MGNNYTANATVADGLGGELIECPVTTEGGKELLDKFQFWVEGILCCAIAVPGFLGNIGSGYVLSTKGTSTAEIGYLQLWGRYVTWISN